MDVSNWIQGEQFPMLANNTTVFYRATHDVNIFFKTIKVSGDFVLISHNSDGCVSHNPLDVNDADSKLMPDNLMHWFAQNVDVTDQRIESIPIGLENTHWFPELHKKHSMLRTLGRLRTVRNLVYMNHNIGTNADKRLQPYQLLEGKSWVTTEHGGNGGRFDEYITNIYTHQFVICPDGHGLDTHRVWETLYMGSIPIQKRNVNNQFYTDLPILFVDDWQEVSESYLQAWLTLSIGIKWNMEKLTFGYWKHKIQNYVNVK